MGEKFLDNLALPTAKIYRGKNLQLRILTCVMKNLSQIGLVVLNASLTTSKLGHWRACLKLAKHILELCADARHVAGHIDNALSRP